MIEKLSQKDKRTLKLGVIAAGLILLYFVILGPWMQGWKYKKASLQNRRAKLDAVLAENGTAAVKQRGLLSVVPVLELPKAEKEQGPLFRGKFNEQLKKAGIKTKTLQLTLKKTGGGKMLRLQCKGKCNWGQAMDLLAELNSNPYFAGVEEMVLKCNPKKPQEVELTLAVSAFVK